MAINIFFFIIRVFPQHADMAMLADRDDIKVKRERVRERQRERWVDIYILMYHLFSF